MLDGTLREGAHDMRVFGLGFLRSVASYDDYGVVPFHANAKSVI